jgi:ketosteroid isomerase-like protein
MIMLPLALLISSNLAQVPAPTPAALSLVAAEYAFADKTEKEGLRSGFMSALRPDSFVFIPRAVNGQTYYNTMLEMGELLTWYPAVAEASQAGDLGYTTGPYTYRAAKDAPVGAQGWFVCLWQRDGGGPWKVRIDIGIPTPDPGERPMPAPLPRAAATLGPVAAAPGSAAELMEMDRTFSKEAAKSPTAAATAYQTRLEANVRFYRKGRFPQLGPKTLSAALDADAVSWEPSEGWVAASGDLGCTRGTLQHKDKDGKPTSTCNYVRMWKKQGAAWKLALDLELALPAAK